MVRFTTLCAIAVLAPLAAAFGQPQQYTPGKNLERDNQVRASVQQRVAEGITRERLQFRSEADAQAWAFEAISEQGTGQARMYVEVQGKFAVRLVGEGLADAGKTRTAVLEAWNRRSVEKPALLLFRHDAKVAAFGTALPSDAAELKAKLPQLTVDPEAARPIASVVEGRKIEMPVQGAAAAVQPPG